MKKTIILLMVMFIVLPTMQVFSQKEKNPPNVEEKMVIIKGNEGWKNTEIKLLPKDKVSITATGKVCFSNGEKQSCMEADGWGVETYGSSWPANWNYCDDPMPEENHVALIGNVGSDDFLVGKATKFFGKEGVLYLGVNDCTLKGEYYNIGQFEVYIKVERAK